MGKMDAIFMYLYHKILCWLATLSAGESLCFYLTSQKAIFADFLAHTLDGPISFQISFTFSSDFAQFSVGFSSITTWKYPPY